MKKILIIVQDYPSKKNPYPMAYVHSRILLYLQNERSISINVLSFKTKENYSYEGISVLCEKNIDKFVLDSYDSIVSHAPNLKNHYRFLRMNKIEKVTFFFHGHEVLNVSKYYPEPYVWNRNKSINKFKSFYNLIKLSVLSRYFSRNKLFKFIFVSEWMKKEALTCLKLKELNNSYIIHNPINKVFIDNSYDYASYKTYDFITIRPLDGSKYCLDIIYEIAKNNSQLKFKIIGKGEFFSHLPKLDNIFWDDNFYSPIDLLKQLNNSKYALMPTRLDSQGVMMCELAAFGMPIITSDIDICKEMLNGYNKAYYISNDQYLRDFHKLTNLLTKSSSIKANTDTLRHKFNPEEIALKELEVILDVK